MGRKDEMMRIIPGYRGFVFGALVSLRRGGVWILWETGEEV